MPQPLVLADPNLLPLPMGQHFYTERLVFRLDDRGRTIPNFNVTELAGVFFGREAPWMFRHLRAPGRLVMDGENITGTKDPDTHLRWFSLLDVEKIAHCLAHYKYGLTGRDLTRSVLIVKCIAENYGYL